MSTPTDKECDAFVAVEIDGETQQHYASRIGVTQPAVSKLLRRYRQKTGVSKRTPLDRRTRRKVNPRFVHLSALTIAA